MAPARVCVCAGSGWALMWMGSTQVSCCPALWSEFGQVTNREPIIEVQPLSLEVT